MRECVCTPARSAVPRWCSGLIPILKLLLDGIFKERPVAGDDGQARGRDEVAALVFDRIVADDRALGNFDVAGDDDSSDAAVAAVGGLGEGECRAG